VKYIKNSLVVDSIEMETIRECAAKNKIIVSLGFSENDGNSLYIAQCTIGSDGQIKMKRRKIKPTHMERTIFGDGSGSSLTQRRPDRDWKGWRIVLLGAYSAIAEVSHHLPERGDSHSCLAASQSS
jgi:predicted amidohydrolase